ncbi:maltooligosyltrehalose synthase [Bradyrhizobium sp. LM4.3]
MPPAIPLATYRLQLTADFDFDKATAVVPYLKALGITHLYTSAGDEGPQGLDARL